MIAFVPFLPEQRINHTGRSVCCAIAVLAIFGLPSRCWGEFTTLDFAASANSQLQLDGFSGGIGLPDADTGALTLGGVPFYIPTAGNNYWLAALAGGDNPRILTINTAIPSATDVHTLINCYAGIDGPASFAYIEFLGSGGAYYRQDLIGGSDIRDYNSYIFSNTINNTTTTQVLSYAPLNFTTVGRLDKQDFVLPVTFLGQTLTTIRLVDNGFDLPNPDPHQRVFLAGATVQSVPEPSSLVLATACVLALFAHRKLRARVS